MPDQTIRRIFFTTIHLTPPAAWNPAVTLGCVAGSHNAVAALGAIQDNLESTLPVTGYTVTYAVGSLALILSGMIVAILA